MNNRKTYEHRQIYIRAYMRLLFVVVVVEILIKIKY